MSALLKHLYGLLLCHRTLARALARARVRARALAPDREIAPMTHPAPAADFHQPLDVHRDLLAEISLHAALLFDHAADFPNVLFRQILDAHIRAHARRGEDVVRPLPADP